MPTDEVVRALRDRVRRLPVPVVPPPGPLEGLAWLLLHRAVPFDPAVQAVVADAWDLPVPPGHGVGPRVSPAAGAPATSGRVSAAQGRLVDLAAAAPRPPVLDAALSLAASVPRLDEPALRDALVAAGLSEAHAGPPLLRGLAALWDPVADQPSVWPGPDGQERLRLLAAEVRRCGALACPDRPAAAEAGWLRATARVEWESGHLIAADDRASGLARPVRRQLAALGPLPVACLVQGVARKQPPAMTVTQNGLRAWAAWQRDLAPDGDCLGLKGDPSRWLFPTDAPVLELLHGLGQARAAGIMAVLQREGLTRGSARQWIRHCVWLRRADRHGVYRRAR